MKRLKIYIDTSVIGGLFDDKFKRHTKQFIENIKNNQIVGVISEITIRELENAPALVRESFRSYQDKLEIIYLTDEIGQLATDYVKDKVITKKYYEDAIHIACATVCQVDLLVSWNFKHIVNFNRISQFNAVNIKNGYKALQIFSPMEVIYEK